jgi:hypothetical protein
MFRKILGLFSFLIGALVVKNLSTAVTKHTGAFTILDASEETSNWGFNIGAITAISLPGFLTNFGNLRTSLGNIIKGVVKKEKWVGDDTTITNVPPTDSTAQVELKFLLSYEGDTSKKVFHSEIATPDTDLLIAGTDKVDLTDPAVADFITDFETIARSPDSDLETVTVLDMTLVGRNR